uniref:Candidate secreted effector n=1 Tax=Meloidogyne incognita TaxID=6306 RepID=A0A914NUN9_MELIC
MCLANQVCDSLLLSAPFSTFGFWMAYLLPEVGFFIKFLFKKSEQKIRKQKLENF